MEQINGKPKDEKEKQQLDEELLLKQITELVINQRLLSGKSHIEDKIISFVHPEELKVRYIFYDPAIFCFKEKMYSSFRS